jgi:hypothetical protein
MGKVQPNNRIDLMTKVASLTCPFPTAKTMPLPPEYNSDFNESNDE